MTISVLTAGLEELKYPTCVDKVKMGKKDIAKTYDYEFVISEKLLNLLKENNITGAEFGSAHHKRSGKTKIDPVLYQLKSANTLPPLHEKTVFFKEKFCENCRRSGLFLDYLQTINNKGVRFDIVNVI
jgi:hypothetical protein